MVSKINMSENIYKIYEIYYAMAINQHLWNIALNLQLIQEEFCHFYQLFPSRHSID